MQGWLAYSRIASPHSCHLSISKFGWRECAPPVRPLILELLSPALGVHHRIYPLALSFLPTYSVSQWLDACFCLYCSSSGNKIYSVVWSCLLICSYQITRTVGHSSSRKTSLCSINFVSLRFHICRGSAVIRAEKIGWEFTSFSARKAATITPN